MPQLWPLGMYTAVGNGLNISDVRLMVDAADLQQYMELMQRLPRAVAQYHTVRQGVGLFGNRGLPRSVQLLMMWARALQPFMLLPGTGLQCTLRAANENFPCQMS